MFSQLTIERFESRLFERLVEFSRFPELSRTSGFFSGLSSPGKCQNKILGLPRFSRTCTNPVHTSRLLDTDELKWLYGLEKVPGPFEKRAPFTVVKMGQRLSMNIFPGHSYHNVYLYCIYHIITKAFRTQRGLF